jgi:anti-anti-sigma factor
VWRFGARWRTLVASMALEIKSREIRPGVAAVEVSGRVMMGPESEKIVDAVDGLIKKGCRTIIFDLSGITAIDSTGIGRFISSFNRVQAAGGEMRMAGAGGHVFEAFHVSLLDTVFPFYDNVEAAAKV